MNPDFVDFSARALFTFDSTLRQQESDFFLVDPETYVDDWWVRSPKIEMYLEALFRHRVLFLFCSPEMEIRSLLLYLAGHFHHHLVAKDDVPSPAFDVLEWSRANDLNRLEAVLHGQEQAGLLLFADLEPEHCRLDVDRLRIATHNRHFMIIGSKATRQQWGLDRATNGCFEIEPRTLFSQTLLNAQLDKLLKLYRHQLPLRRQEPATPDGPLFQEYAHPTVDKVYQLLNTPFKVDAYLSFLKQASSPLAEQDLVTWMETVGGGPEDLSHWYRMQSRDTQLLGLALSLFGSLYTDQFFAVVELLTAKVWRDQLPGLKAYDYWDLEYYRPYFGFYNHEDGSISAYRPEYGEWLLEAGLARFRRFIIANLNHLVDLAIAASSMNEADGGLFSERAMTGNPDEITRVHQFREIFGHPKHWNNMRCRRLRATVVETLGKLFVRMPKPVEPCLAVAACQERISVKRVVAQVLAAEPSTGASTTLDVLEAWLMDAEKRRELIKMSPGLDEETAKSRLDQTVVMAVLYINTGAAFDKDRYLAFLEQLTFRSRSTTTEFCEQVLPRLIVRDGDFLVDQIILWSSRYKLAKGLALGLADLFLQRPEAAQTILASLEQRLRQLPDEQQTHYPNMSESRAVTIALAYGYVDLGALSQDNERIAITRLMFIFGLSQRPFIRQAVFVGLARHYTHSDAVRSMIRTFAGTLSTRDLEQAIETYVDIKFTTTPDMTQPTATTIAYLRSRLEELKSDPIPPSEALDFMRKHAQAAFLEMVMSWCRINPANPGDPDPERLNYLWLLVLLLIDMPNNEAGEVGSSTRILEKIERHCHQRRLKDLIQETLIRRMIATDEGKKLEMTFLNKLHSENLDHFAYRLFAVFQEERAALKGGDAFVTLAGRHIPVWLNVPRPATNVERLMASWRSLPGLPQNLELLVRDMIYRQYDIKEAELIPDLRNKPVEVVEPAPVAVEVTLPEPELTEPQSLHPTRFRRMLLFYVLGWHKGRYAYFVEKIEAIRQLYTKHRQEDQPSLENGGYDRFQYFLYPDEQDQHLSNLFKMVKTYDGMVRNEGCLLFGMATFGTLLLALGVYLLI